MHTSRMKLSGDSGIELQYLKVKKPKIRKNVCTRHHMHRKLLLQVTTAWLHEPGLFIIRYARNRQLSTAKKAPTGQ